MKLKYYIKSFRLRTLPLSISGIIMGSFIAIAENYFNLKVFILAIATTLSLQILANLSNELGDLKKGTDNEKRLGPIYSTQSGKISYKDINRMIIIFIFISMFIGSLLIYSVWNIFSFNFIIFCILGVLSIIAALTYTLGKNAYGYKGLGDIFVFVFFGLVSTCGSYFLMTNNINFLVFLPASSIGLLSVAVLNVNNMRDIENDKICNKKTIPVKIGLKKSKIYHTILILMSFMLFTIYIIIEDKNYFYVLIIPLFVIHLKNIIISKGRNLDKQMSILSLSILVFTLLAGISIYF